MTMKTLALSCLAAIGLACNASKETCTVSDVVFEPIGRIHYRTPSYLEVAKWGTEDFLLISEFNGSPWRSGSVAIAPGLKDAVIAGDVDDIKPVKLDPSPYRFENPNNAKVVPDDVFAGVNAVLVPDGFVIPGHRDGGAYILVQDNDDITKTIKTVRVSPYISKVWYHTGHWIDLNGDGRKDLLIARTNSQKGGGELVWFEHPAADALDGATWPEHVITTGPHVDTYIETLAAYPGEVVVWAAQFFDESLAVYRVSLTDGTLVDSRVIDSNTIKLDGSETKRTYSVKVVDLNGDGNRQLLVNNWEQSEEVNGLWAYEVPADIIGGTYVKHPIVTGFPMSWKYWFSGISGPGYPFIFHPDGNTSQRAHILLDGHGNDKFYLLTPTGNAAAFEYQMDVVEDAGVVVPYVVQSDLDGDGYQELFVAHYQSGYVQAFKTKPAV